MGSTNQPAADAAEPRSGQTTPICTFYDAMAAEHRMATVPDNFSKVTQMEPASTSVSAAPKSACAPSFEMSKACIAEQGLDDKVAAFQHHLEDAQKKLGTSYKIDVQHRNNAPGQGCLHH